MKRKIFLLCALLTLLSGCSRSADTPPPAAPAEIPPQTSADSEIEKSPAQQGPSGDHLTEEGRAETVDPGEQEPQVLTITDKEHWKTVLEQAVCALEQMPVMDISGADFSEDPEMDAKNLYYALLSEQREYCYAYDLTASVQDGMMTVEIHYMPYRTGIFPEGYEGIEAGSLRELAALAKTHLGKEEVAVRITNPTLLFDAMNTVLRQVGGGYILCQLNREGTALQYSPATGFTMEECMDYLARSEELSREIVSEYITEDMTTEEVIRTLYVYLTDNVTYDQRYYTDLAALPYHARTAYGALHDHSAICGGYSLAFQLLLKQAGIESCTVSGTYNAENHMWCAMMIDGELCYFDPTADRGTDSKWFRYCGVSAEKLFGHVWDADEVLALLS